MHLLSPWWWLLLLPLAGTLILFYLLKLRRRAHQVPSVFLWEQALQDLQSNVPLQKLRKNLLLLVQLIIIIFIVAALSRPAMEWARPGGQSVVLVVDGSASMQSTDVSPTRFAAAKRAGRAAIEALGPRDSMMIVAIGGATRALTPFTSDKRALRAALDRLQVSDTRADLRGALELAVGLASGKKDGAKRRVAVISDGALPVVALPGAAKLSVSYVKIGRRSDNVGIVVMDARRRLRGGGFEGLAVIKNFGKSARTFTLELSIDGKLWDAREISLKPGARDTEVLRQLPPGGGVLRARLDIRDDLAVDNEARLILPSIEPVEVVLATPGNLFLKTALTLDPTLTVTERSTAPLDLPAGTVLIADNVPISRLPRGVSALLIGNAGAAIPGQAAGTVSVPAIADWDRQHPALANVDLTGLHITSATTLIPARSARVLIEADAGPIAVAAERNGQRIVYLGWDLHRSDFPLRASFPIFIANCVDWLSSQRQRMQSVNLRTGQVLRVPVPPGVEEVTLRTPDGRSERLRVRGAPLIIDQVTRSGLYRVTGKEVDLLFAANLLDPGESDLTPQDSLRLRGESDATVAAQRGPVRTERELWRVVLLLVLALLGVEWWIFHRRIG